MTTKTKTITVSIGHKIFANPAKTYRVEKVTNSVDVAPSDYLTKAEVEEYCTAPGWTVTVLPNAKKAS